MLSATLTKQLINFMKPFEELNLFEKKKMILNEMNFEYIPHNSEFNQSPFFPNSNEGYFVKKNSNKHLYNHKTNIFKESLPNLIFFGNVLPKNKFNPNTDWNDLYKVIDFMLDKEIFEDEFGRKLGNYSNFFRVVTNDGWIKCDNIETTFEAIAKYFYNRINNIYED